MPLYDMHCTGENCKYRGEQLYITMEELVGARCPDCSSKLEKDAAQHFSIGGKSGKSGNPIKCVTLELGLGINKSSGDLDFITANPPHLSTPEEIAKAEAVIERNNALPSVN